MAATIYLQTWDKIGACLKYFLNFFFEVGNSKSRINRTFAAAGAIPFAVIKRPRKEILLTAMAHFFHQVSGHVLVIQ